MVRLASSSLENLFSDFLLHHDDHFLGWRGKSIEKVEENRARDIVGNIGDN
jgi:hypothetical protein